MIKRQITKEQTMNLLCCVFLRIVYPICCQFENNSRLIRSFDSKMDRQCNGQQKKENRTNNELIVLFFSSYFVPYVTSFPALSIFDCPFVLPVSLHCPFLIAPSCCQFPCIVHFWLSLRYSLTFICQFPCIVHFWLAFRYSLTFICQFPCIVHFWLSLRYSLTFIIYKALHSDSVNGVYAIDKDIYL